MFKNWDFILIHTISFNIFIQIKLNFHKINSFFSSIDELIITRSAQQHEAQVKIYKYQYIYVHLVLFFGCVILGALCLLAIPLPLLAKTNVPKPILPIMHDASFSTIAMGPCTIGSKGYNFFKTPLQVSNRYGFAKK
jgi:hypothetical protein